MSEPNKQDRARSIVNTCRMFGIEPPRLIDLADLKEVYRGMPTLVGGLWHSFQVTQHDLSQADIDEAAEPSPVAG